MARTPFLYAAVLVSCLVTAGTMHSQATQTPARKSKASATQKNPATQTAAVSEQVQDKLVAREKDLAAAEKRKAFAVIDEALADDFHELATDGRLYGKADIMPMLKDVNIEDYSLTDMKVFPVDAECVVVTYVSTVKGSYKGAPFPPKNAISSLWARRHGSWQVVFHQATPIPEQQQ